MASDLPIMIIATGANFLYALWAHRQRKRWTAVVYLAVGTLNSLVMVTTPPLQDVLKSVTMVMVAIALILWISEKPDDPPPPKKRKPAPAKQKARDWNALPDPQPI